MCTVYCLHAKKRPWFLVDMSHFLDRKPKIIFPTFLLFDSVMERLFINLKSKLGSIDRRRSLLRCIINHCQRKPCVGNAIATKLPLQISSHRVFQLFGPARLSWLPRFVPASECTASTKVAAVQENMIMNHIHLNSINSFHLQKKHQFPIWTFFLIFHHFPKKNNKTTSLCSAHHHSPSPSQLWGYWIRMDPSLSPWIFGIHPPIDASAKRLPNDGRNELTRDPKRGPQTEASENHLNIPQSSWVFFFR